MSLSGRMRIARKLRALHLLFLIAPVTLLGMHYCFTMTVDDYRYAANIDPDYAYLMSSLDLSRLQKSRMVLHPGATLQVASHVVMRCAFRLFRHSEGDFQASVLRDPSFYLNVIHHTFALTNVALVFFLGLFAYRVSGSAAVGLFLQWTPFASAQILRFGFRQVTAEVALISVSLVLCLMLLKWAHSNPDRRTTRAYSILLGVISGLGLATRTVFLPMLAIPIVLLPSTIARAVYVLTTAVVTLVCLLPLKAGLSQFLRFYGRIATHTGIYGQGKTALWDPEEYAANLLRIAVNDPPFVLILLFAIAVIMLILVAPERRRLAGASAGFRTLLAVALAQIMSVAMVARHYKAKYLLPGMCLSVLLAYLSGSHLARLYRNGLLSRSRWMSRRGWLCAVLGAFFVCASIHSLRGLSEFHRMLQDTLREAETIRLRLAKDFPGHGVIYYYNWPSPIFGLQFGNRWTPVYGGALRKLHGDRYFFDPFMQALYNWETHKRVPLKVVKDQYDGKVVFVGWPFHRFRRPVKDLRLPLRNVFQGRYLAMQELVGPVNGGDPETEMAHGIAR